MYIGVLLQLPFLGGRLGVRVPSVSAGYPSRERNLRDQAVPLHAKKAEACVPLLFLITYAYAMPPKRLVRLLFLRAALFLCNRPLATALSTVLIANW